MHREKVEKKTIPTEILKRNRKKRISSALLVILTVLLSISLFVLVSTAVERFGWKIDLTENQLYQLTEETKKILSELEQPVNLTYCGRVNGADRNIQEVLERYEAASEYIVIEYMDLAANPASVEQWSARNIFLSDDGVLIQSGSKARFVEWSELYALNAYTDEAGTQRYSLSGLQAEAKITAGIVAVTTQNEEKIAFTAGHSEDVQDTLKDLLANSGYEAEQVVLGVEELSESISTILIAGARRDFSEKELEILDEFMARGGNLMVFRNPEVASLPNLDNYLASWGIQIEYEIVLEPRQQMDSPLNIIPVFGVSMINVYFSETSTYLVLPECRALRLSDVNGCLTSTVLQSTSDAYGKDYANMTSLTKEPEDIPGPFPLAAISEKATADQKGESKSQYVFAMACTDFYSDKYLQTESLANGQLILQALSYMNNREITLNIPVKSLSAGDIVISHNAVVLFSAVFLVAIPLGLLGVGAMVFIKRRRS